MRKLRQTLFVFFAAFPKIYMSLKPQNSLNCYYALIFLKFADIFFKP